MVKICSFCSNEITETNDKPVVIHDRCFELYKGIPKTKDNYIILCGKYKGHLYSSLLDKNPHYIEWIEVSKFDEQTPMAYLQNFHKKIKQNKNYFSKEIN